MCKAVKKWRIPSDRINLPSTINEMSVVKIKAAQNDDNVESEIQRQAAKINGEVIAEKIAGVILWLTKNNSSWL